MPDVSAPEVSETCSPNDVVHHVEPSSSGSEPACGTSSRTPAEIAQARAYVVETAMPGYTMTRQGPEVATERLHPEFVVRLANAIRASAQRRPAVCRSFLGLSPARVRSRRLLRQVQFAAHLWARRRHERHRQARIRRSAALARNRRQERRRLSLWSAQPGRMEPLPADERQDHPGRESAARDRSPRRARPISKTCSRPAIA